MKCPADVQALLADLIAIPSVATAEASGGTTPGEAALATYVGGFFRSLGAEVECRDVVPGRPNLMAWFSSSRPDVPTLALVPHLDTVGIENMTIAPFKPLVRDGRMYGRGACDTKGPMAAAMWAVRDWVRSGRSRGASYNLLFAATMGEEELSLGASAFCLAGFQADLAVALEPTGLKAVRGAKGVLRLWVKATGRAAHGSAPEMGESAIYKLLPFLRACRDELMPGFSRIIHQELGAATLNIGVIRAGTELNIVPDAGRVGLDIRTHPGFSNDQALACVQSVANGLSVEIFRVGPSFFLDANSPVLAPLHRASTGSTTVPWFSDANVFNQHGIPAVAFGPGSIAQAHTRDEFIELAALDAGVAALTRLLEDASPETIPTRSPAGLGRVR